jgi:hypothetical protein
MRRSLRDSLVIQFQYLGSILGDPSSYTRLQIYTMDEITIYEDTRIENALFQGG